MKLIQCRIDNTLWDKLLVGGLAHGTLSAVIREALEKFAKEKLNVHSQPIAAESSGARQTPRCPQVATKASKSKPNKKFVEASHQRGIPRKTGRTARRGH